VSDTPRTDAARPPYTALQEFVLSEFARTLERELNAANERINRLETALRRIANTDYRGNRSTESQIAFEALKP
jgi:hypothetical protein